jgi:hypothetical protein
MLISSMKIAIDYPGLAPKSVLPFLCNLASIAN